MLVGRPGDISDRTRCKGVGPQGSRPQGSRPQGSQSIVVQDEAKYFGVVLGTIDSQYSPKRSWIAQIPFGPLGLAASLEDNVP